MILPETRPVSVDQVPMAETARAVKTGPTDTRHPGSFRDPAGFIFERDGVVHRQINEPYADTYARLMDSGLYQNLVDAGLLIPHVELADDAPPAAKDAHRVIRPEPLGFNSQPFEWSFTQLRDSALATLDIQRRAMRFGLSLKDASAYNIQLHNTRPVLIDTLSFEIHDQDYPWVGYRQFCQHFLAPLALMAHVDVRLGRMMESHIDGIPIDLASRLLPFRTMMRFGLAVHIHFHAKSQRRLARPGTDRSAGRGRMNPHRQLAVIGSLESTIKRLKWNSDEAAWSDYYEQDSYDEVAFADKRRIVGEYLRGFAPEEVWDIGANTGVFSRLATDVGARVVSIDNDPGPVDINYRQVVAEGESNLYPIVADLTNPSPSLGWENRERSALLDRGPTDTVMALALIHHLAISNNVPFSRLASFFAGRCRTLIIEFVPEGDPKVQRLLSMRDHDSPDIPGRHSRPHSTKTFRSRDGIRSRDPGESCI